MFVHVAKVISTQPHPNQQVNSLRGINSYLICSSKEDVWARFARFHTWVIATNDRFYQRKQFWVVRSLDFHVRGLTARHSTLQSQSVSLETLCFFEATQSPGDFVHLEVAIATGMPASLNCWMTSSAPGNGRADVIKRSIASSRTWAVTYSKTTLQSQHDSLQLILTTVYAAGSIPNVSVTYLIPKASPLPMM